jgi:hypothetical protein
MARCPNKNTAEYKALQSVYKTELNTNNIITSWQDLNNTDVFPTIVQAGEFVNNQKIAFSLKKDAFAKSLLYNLNRERIGHILGENFLINNSTKEVKEYSSVVLESNVKRLYRYLRLNNIPAESVSLERTAKSYKLTVNENLLSATDILESSRSWDTPRAREVVMHLKRIFPQINVKMLSVAEGSTLYNSLPDWKKNKVKFLQVNSFYVDGTAYLIKGRVTDETAIEEILHPFIDAIKKDNSELFDGLLAEASLTFPKMVQEIIAGYNEKVRKFSSIERDLEIVTQALSRHFNQEYENTPSISFLNKVKEALEWFMNVINNLNEYLTGKPLSVRDINANTNFSDIAKLLNTEGIQFKLESKVDGKVRYNLSPDKQKQINQALGKANGLQVEIINKLFHQASKSKQEIDSLSANVRDTGNIIVTLNKSDHTYIDITSGEIYTSVTTQIKGKLKNQEDVQLNLDIGNDVDTLLDALVTHKTVEDVFSEMNVLDINVAKNVFNTLETTLANIMPEGSVALSQVVVFDEATKTAGTADLVIIDKHGRIKIVDLKTTKNSLSSYTHTDTRSGRQQTKYYDKEWTLSEESLLKQKGIDKLSTRGQHNLQVNIYRRMFENMGYDVYEGDYAASTFHLVADISGKGKNQKFNGKIKADAWIEHPISQNIDMVNMLVPSLGVNVEAAKLKRATENKEDKLYEGDINDPDLNVKDVIDPLVHPEYNTITGALDNYQVALLDKKDAIKTIKSQIYMDKTQDAELDQIAMTIAFITIAKSEGPIARSTAFSELLQDALKQIRSFSDYVSDPKNINKPEFITYVLNFSRFKETFRGLHSVSESGELNATQRSLILSLKIELTKLGSEDVNNPGLINTAIDSFVMEQIRTRSSNEYGVEGSHFTEEMLQLLMKEATDITGADYNVRDMSTSPDVILAVMDKMFKAKKQELLDRVGERELIIREAANKVLKLTEVKDKERAWDYFLQFDSNGEFDGMYVTKIGKKYSDKQEALRNVLYDNDANPYQYREIKNLEDATQEDIEYNIDLANKKAALGDFFRAEEIDEYGNRVDGEYHYYTQEFIDERNKYEYFISNGEANKYVFWERKPGISGAEYAKFESKYFDNIQYTRAVRVNGEPTGAIVRDERFRPPKVEYRKAKEVSSKGENMRSEQYDSIMNPTTALGVAQKEFYELFVNMFEKDLLKKLPEGIMNDMLGRVPLVKNNLINDMAGKTSLWNKMYANTIGNNAWDIFKQTSEQRGVQLDENGNIINGMPVYYVGRARTENEMSDVLKEVSALKSEYKAGKITKDNYDSKKAVLNGKLARLRATPTKSQVSRDMPNSLLKFSAMAQNYETMGSIDDTLKAMVQVIEKRKYQPAESRLELVSKKAGKIVRNVGTKMGNINSSDNTIRRAKKWMNMVYYDNEMITKGAFDKISESVVQLSSLAYVAFNPFGNFNNYVIGRVNNNIELLGARFYSRKAYLRANKEFHRRVLPDLVSRTGHGLTDLTDVVTLGIIPGLKESDYDAKKPNSKYEAFVDSLRMMDKMTDLREQEASTSEGKSWFERASEWGYIMQDAAEYNVQTKVGMAVLMDTTMKNSTTGETLSYYDAFDYDAKTHTNVLKEGYDTAIIKAPGQLIGKEVPYTDQVRYDLRNKIREVNKQIHGSYAKEDRMVIQGYTLGKLAVQFKKWVAPAVRARYAREYFDQNLGWMEGRYLSWWKFMAYTKQQLVLGNKEFNTYGKGFMEHYGADGKGGNADQRAQNKLFGFYRTMGEIGIILSTYFISTMLDSMLAGDDDDSDLTKRFKNIVKYQGDRTFKELVLFSPTPAGVVQQYQMFDSPIAATRTLGEMAELASMSLSAPFVRVIQGKEGFQANSSYVYQNGDRAGKLKIYKNFADVVPIVYSIQKWDSYLINDDFYIK